jgi:hypothetical protein
LGSVFNVSIRIPYKKFPDTRGEVGYFAAIPVNIALPAKNSPRSKRFEAIIDSGATRCVFHAQLGKAIGLDVIKGEPETTNGIAGPTTVYLHNISLYAPGGIIALCAAFSLDLPIAGLLGMRGFFDNFKITFDPTVLQCELERLYLA